MVTIYLSTGKELEVTDAEYHELFEHFMDASLPDELTYPPVARNQL